MDIHTCIHPYVNIECIYMYVQCIYVYGDKVKYYCNRDGDAMGTISHPHNLRILLAGIIIIAGCDCILFCCVHHTFVSLVVLQSYTVCCMNIPNKQPSRQAGIWFTYVACLHVKFIHQCKQTNKQRDRQTYKPKNRIFFYSESYNKILNEYFFFDYSCFCLSLSLSLYLSV